MDTTILFIAHGSRRFRSNDEVRSFVELFSRRHKNFRVALGFVELEEPSFIDVALREIKRSECSKLIVLPIFLFSSRHVKNDIPIVVEKIRAQFPEKEIICASSMGASENLISIVRDRIREEYSFNEENASLLMVGRGSSDPSSNGEFEKISRMVYEKGGFQNVFTSYVGITSPKVEDVLNLISRVRPKKLVIVPYFLFYGRLLEQLEKEIEHFKKNYPWIDVVVTSYLGVHEKFVNYFSEHIERILRKDFSQTLPCVTCHYRPEMKEISKNVKGVESLLWSVRHMYTHSMTKPHEYPHANLKKHVFICENVDCAAKGSKEFARRMRKQLKEKGLEKEIKVTKTSCMGKCGEGPVVAVYPDGVWYREVENESLDKIFVDHLLNNQIVDGCVDDIMV